MSIPKPTIRSSSMPLFMTCAPAVLNPDNIPAVEQEWEASLSGTLGHALAESVVKNGTFDLEAAKKQMPEEEYARTERLFNNFLDIWREAGAYMKRPVTEWEFKAELSHATITGHIDVHAVEPGRAYIIDYKTGRQHENHYHQMAAYAFGVWDKMGRIADFTAYVTAVYLEDKTVQPYTFTAEALRAWEALVAAQVQNMRYVAGRKCATCPLFGACSAGRQFAAGSIAVLNDDVAVAWEDMTPEERGELIDKMYVVEKAIDRIKLSLRNVVRAKGKLDIGGGYEQTLVESQERVLRPDRALPVIVERLGQGTFNQAAKVSLESMLVAAAARAPKGQKTKARSDLLLALEKAGGTQTIKTTKMWRRPKDEKQLEES
jgi:hypothetical protein